MTQPTQSYTSPSQSVGGTLSELASLFRAVGAAARKVEEDVRTQIEHCDHAAGVFRTVTGAELKGRDALEIGAGQMLGAARCFAVENRVTATDLDAYAEGLDLAGYWRILRCNGAKRLLKTIGRKVLGMDRRFLSELKVQLRPRLAGRPFPRPAFRQMDATKMPFPDNSFDFIYSFNVFEHLPDPRAVLNECRRVLRPGGCVFTHLHLYTSDSGCHDLRIIRGEHDAIDYWPHLRPAHAPHVQNAAYLNRLRLAEWKSIFDEVFGTYHLEFVREDQLRPQLDRIRAGGELAEYSDDELLNKNMITAWTKRA